MVLLMMMMIVVGAVGVKVIVKRSKMSSGRNKGCEYNNKNTKSSGDMTKRRKRALLAKNSFCRFSLFLRLRLRLLHRDLFITVCNTSC